MINMENYDGKLRGKMIAELDVLGNKYKGDIIDCLYDMVKECDSYDKLVDAAPIIFSFDGTMAALAAVNNELAREMGTNDDVVGYITRSVPEIYKIFNWDRKLVENHIILVHSMYETLKPEPTIYEEDEEFMYDGLEDDFGLPSNWDELTKDIINSNKSKEIYDNIDISSLDSLIDSMNEIIKKDGCLIEPIGSDIADIILKLINSSNGTTKKGVNILLGTPEDIEDLFN